MMKLARFTLITCLLMLSAVVLMAQDDYVDSEDNVYVTTQDRSSLRRGPGTLFERITVVPPAVTLQAVGRTADTSWIQVEYEGERGWIADWLLVWTGDLISLPIDGLDPVRYARRTGVAAVTFRETPIYSRQVTPSDQVGVLPAGTVIELTGRLGATGFIQYQILYNDQLYWVGSWNVRITDGRYRSLLDTSYLYPYGRLVTRLTSDVRDSQNVLNTIDSIWSRLDSGQTVSCNNPPERIDRRRTADSDVRSEPIFAPLVQALDEAILRTNTAISLFEDACARVAANDTFLTSQEVRDALVEVDDARRNFILAESLLRALSVRDPFLNNDPNGGR